MSDGAFWATRVGAPVCQGGRVSPEFAFRELPQGGVEFELLGPWSPEAAAAFRDCGADGLVANYARGFVARDLRFLAELPLRRLDILARTIDDLGPVHRLGATLESLRVETGSRTRIDLRRFPELRDLSCQWDQVADSIHDVDSLHSLHLFSYDRQDLQPLAHLRDLTGVRMKERPAVRSLQGVEQLAWLDTLAIQGAPLSDLDALAQLRSPVLRELTFTHCRPLEDLHAVEACEGLVRLDVSECGRISSLAPIAGLSRLERLYLYGSTAIEDGDLAPVLGLRRLRDFRMMNRAHYRPTVTDAKRQLGLDA